VGAAQQNCRHAPPPPDVEHLVENQGAFKTATRTTDGGP
jgi:hypothetical protein